MGVLGRMLHGFFLMHSVLRALLSCRGESPTLSSNASFSSVDSFKREQVLQYYHDWLQRRLGLIREALIIQYALSAVLRHIVQNLAAATSQCGLGSEMFAAIRTVAQKAN